MLINYDFIDHDKIYVLGSSNGGYMAYRLACDLGYRIAAFTSIAGNMFLDNDGLIVLTKVEISRFSMYTVQRIL